MTDPAKVLFRNASYDGQLTRTLAAAMAGSADLGEAMATARRIGKPSGTAWYDAWSKTADQARQSAEQTRASGERASARHGYLRASEYYRQAFYFLRSDLDGRRLQDAYRAHVDTFRLAAALMDHPAEAVRIPYDSTTVGGYLFAPDDSGEARATVIFPCGYDSTAEAGWANVPAALERGYNALVFEGPGQGEALYTQRMFLRPDFEHVLTPVLDWLLTRPEVQPGALVLIGRSFGGYLAPRAASFEHRLAALICDPAQPDMGARIPAGLAGKIAAPVVRAQMRISADRAEFFGARMAAHGLDNIEKYFTELRRFTMLQHAPQITCPTLIIEAEHDFAGGGGQTLADALTAPSQLVPLTEHQGADGHCSGLGQEIWSEAVYRWLRNTLPHTPTAMAGKEKEHDR
jgi:alpha-beta hydrolase superfamily lysophospholipase